MGDIDMSTGGLRKPEKALTAQFVKTVKEPGKYFDGHGLFLRVQSNGARQWVQRIVIRGKRCELGLGNPSLVSLSEARETALANRKLARAGGDPLSAKKEAKAALTFEQAARKVHELHKPTWRNVKHAAQFISTLETYAFPRIGKLKVGDVTTADVLAVLQPIWLKKPETARRVRQRIGTIMKWAVANGWRLDNPADAIAQALPKQDKTQQHRKALPYGEVTEFLETLRTSKAGLMTKLALELVILTASRSGEVRLADWSEMNLENAIWTRPAYRMKANKEHRVPLSNRSIEILTQAREAGSGKGLVFPGTVKGKPLSDMTLSKLVKELGYDVHVHGFRTSFKTWAQEKTNTPRDVSEAALAHTVKDKAEAAYARSDFFEKRRRLMENWTCFLATKSENIVRIG
ncbi:integrase arm-type DNA-binding domain-containing protein [Pseudohalocynthiibacter sp. F2068]|jgi:integrase|uniref:tyrosine-type recombinase/integrase n=1 Tax=Pseudohalocynthiibacter sp. F2068 TaxID=2926418 RepID=UPI001FF55FA3|nr:integrase arm-type DNA-binding domain-containing protein [Pseudohalocynthiibacter sp. F2068]MCK0102354.1 tyrosine-type recombinase/integrase [Pseudohalocynthiibacter sp. F2068]